MKTALVGIGAGMISGMILLFSGVFGLAGIGSIIIGVFAALWYRKKVATPAERTKVSQE